MKIAAAANGATLEAMIGEWFEESQYIVIYDYSADGIHSVWETKGLSGEQIAQRIVESNSEAVVCGNIDEPAFMTLALAGVTRFEGKGLDLKEAFFRALNNDLAYIREYTGGPGIDFHGHHIHEN